MSCSKQPFIDACQAAGSSAIPHVAGICPNCGDVLFGEQHLCPNGSDGRRAAWALPFFEFVRQAYGNSRPVIQADGQVTGFRDFVPVDNVVPEFGERLARMGISCRVKNNVIAPDPAEPWTKEEREQIERTAADSGITLCETGARYVGILEAMAVVKARHRWAVEGAARRGAALPAVVLQEYPHLEAICENQILARVLWSVVDKQPCSNWRVYPDGTIFITRLPCAVEQRLEKSKEALRQEINRQLHDEYEMKFVWKKWNLVDKRTMRILLRTDTADLNEASQICDKKLAKIAAVKAGQQIARARKKEVCRLSAAFNALMDVGRKDWQDVDGLAELSDDPNFGKVVSQLIAMRRAFESGEIYGTLVENMPEPARYRLVRQLLKSDVQLPDGCFLQYPDLVAEYGA